MNFSSIKRFLHSLLILVFFKKRLELLRLLFKSNSQLHQDLFVLCELGFKRDGFFVEFGACNGRYLSNTLLLEKSFNWNGILCEPCRMWHEELMSARSAYIDTRCVWRRTGELIEFSEDQIDAAFSGVSETKDFDTNVGSNSSDCNTELQKYFVESVSLNDLVKDKGDCRNIDFLSIDTEGSEFEILKEFDFEKYRVGVICVEHNYKADRDSIYSLLTSKGFKRKYVLLSRFDDWYVNSQYLFSRS
ncbi:MAG: FkbM family methyltransferase [Bacteroidetes bacterium]|nr:FkbM family methyltransferase [Bacteroidota bacterium]